MANKRKFAPGVWKEEAFRESTTNSSDSNRTQETEESNTMAVDQDTETPATTAAVEELTLEEDETVETPEKKQKIEGGDDSGE